METEDKVLSKEFECDTFSADGSNKIHRLFMQNMQSCLTQRASIETIW